MDKPIYQLRIIYTDAGNRTEGMPYRVVEFDKIANLQSLADHILKFFGYKMTEPFGFYDNMDNWIRSVNKYELFEDDPKKNTIKNTTIEEIFEEVDEYLFVYDYLEEHRFIITLEKEVLKRNVITYPEVIESIGDTPKKNSITAGLFDDDDEEFEENGKKVGSGFRDEDEAFNEYGGGGEDGDLDDEPEDEFGFDEFSSGGGYKDDDF